MLWYFFTFSLFSIFIMKISDSHKNKDNNTDSHGPFTYIWFIIHLLLKFGPIHFIFPFPVFLCCYWSILKQNLRPFVILVCHTMSPFVILQYASLKNMFSYITTVLLSYLTKSAVVPWHNLITNVYAYSLFISKCILIGYSIQDLDCTSHLIVWTQKLLLFNNP